MLISTACLLKWLFILLLDTYYKDETYKNGLQSIFPAENNIVYGPFDILK